MKRNEMGFNRERFCNFGQVKQNDGSSARHVVKVSGNEIGKSRVRKWYDDC